MYSTHINDEVDEETVEDLVNEISSSDFDTTEYKGEDSEVDENDSPEASLINHVAVSTSETGDMATVQRLPSVCKTSAR